MTDDYVNKLTDDELVIALLDIGRHAKSQGTVKDVVMDDIVVPNWFKKKWNRSVVITYVMALSNDDLLRTKLSWQGEDNYNYVGIDGIITAGELRLTELEKPFWSKVWCDIWSQRVRRTVKLFYFALGAMLAWLVSIIIG